MSRSNSPTRPRPFLLWVRGQSQRGESGDGRGCHAHACVGRLCRPHREDMPTRAWAWHSARAEQAPRRRGEAPPCHPERSEGPLVRPARTVGVATRLAWNEGDYTCSAPRPTSSYARRPMHERSFAGAQDDSGVVLPGTGRPARPRRLPRPVSGVVGIATILLVGTWFASAKNEAPAPATQ